MGALGLVRFGAWCGGMLRDWCEARFSACEGEGERFASEDWRGLALLWVRFGGWCSGMS